MAGEGTHGRGRAWQESQPLQRTVRILPECILVSIYFNSAPPSQCKALSICFPSDLVLKSVDRSTFHIQEKEVYRISTVNMSQIKYIIHLQIIYKYILI